MSYDTNNIFARILRGELPCIKLYEDEHTLSFMDIMPQADGHALIISKEPATTLHDLSPEGAAACIQTTQKIARAVEAALDAPGSLVMQLNGAGAGQTVPHVHFHVVPTSIGQLRATPHATNMADPALLEAIAQKIRAQL
ncbi:HIT family protein [Marinobacter mobilis]|uniref:Histidine triad (HIT) family protein n=1 Tax=Marinobacter mobilis TaxID=488533 RepID=A0A1H3C3I6_9GAMM|nr:HIT family protein [Marinobacter mobilis]SDX00905.1 histidine triad (HIT) family protein [Marinobacter mobilis]SDX48723.1 histidine triad (HIT) family protein [Marinobacter mobilis]